MDILTSSGWDDYSLIDSGEGMRLERFGTYILIRPDPQAIWKRNGATEWNHADAIFERGSDGRERWHVKTQIGEKWEMKWRELTFFAKLSPFKHTGVFPEQILQWEWIDEKITSTKNPVSILNLFAYTGIASLVSAAAGAKVTHVDASRPTIGWARENQAVSHLSEKPIRWILDDAIKFTEREVKRGIKYDGIIMDPPIYGHGPDGQIWDFPKSFPKLLEICKQLLSDKPLFILVNAYAISSSALMLSNMLDDIKKSRGGSIQVGELALQESTSQRLLSTGIYGRWSSS